MANPTRIPGPLAPYKDGLIADLHRQGYTRLSICSLVCLTAQLGRWLDRFGIKPAELTTHRLDRFLRYRRRLGYTWRPTIHGFKAILSYLRRLRVIPADKQKAPRRTALTKLIDGYGEYLEKERSLSPAGTSQYQYHARRFLSATLGGAPALGRLRTADVSSFILAEARRSSVGYVKMKVTALRSFLRYLHVRGEIKGDLSGAVPAIAGWRLAGLPKGLDQDQTRKFLHTFDRRTHMGRRGYAIALLMLRLGLRAAEAVSLRLDDCDWSRGELVIRGKQGREDRLPIPRDVGEAIVSYLRFTRPRSTLRSLFLSERAPRRNITCSMVKALVRDAGDRCGIPNLGTHRLRHTAATQMLRKGSTLQEIGQVLRHHSIDTTAIYAKVDHESLRLVCQPWPEATL